MDGIGGIPVGALRRYLSSRDIVPRRRQPSTVAKFNSGVVSLLK
jgi:hypothetical protein